MDDRQTEIRAGAGLEDSRINKEFIDFLNKWSSPVIMVFAVAALVWAGLRWMEQKKLEKIDLAFQQLQNATVGGNPSPATLLALAAEYEGVKSVPEIAKLTTVDLYLNAFLRGVEPGAGQGGAPIEETDQLDEDQRNIYLDQAGTLAQEVIASTESVEGKELLTMHGLIRAGAVAESKRDFDGAKSFYSRMITLANEEGLPSLAHFGQIRLDAVDSYDIDLVLPSRDDLAVLPGEEVPEIPELPEELIDSTTDAVDEAGAVIDEAIDEAADAVENESTEPAVENPQP